MTEEEALDKLRARAKSDQLEGMERFGMTGKGRLGVSIPDLRKIAKEIGKDQELSMKLWKTGVQEARMLAAMIGEPGSVTGQQMEEWVKEIDSWDVCDQVCMNLFEKVPLARQKIHDWSRREEEFVKRTAFSLIACLAWHDKQAPDEDFLRLLPLARAAATDDRNFVKKAVSWALRNIGKRNLHLNEVVLETARNIRTLESRAARWIASGVIRELESEAVQRRLKSRSGGG
jgi:3-methyladenine DNA glycosylase AlkD